MRRVHFLKGGEMGLAKDETCRSGDVIREEYKCPCGSGQVVYGKENIPSFRSIEIDCYCKLCNEKYDFGRGTATLKNNY